MCGISGIWRSGGAPGGDLERDVVRMMDAIAHRGPDDSGTFLEPDAGLALGFRRLSILDLSALGHQPMRSASGRYVIIYNGEVYNFADLRTELEGRGFVFRSTSDTEVILAAVEAWGVEAALGRFVGMFAIALWDGRERRLHLVRDRLGIKPLYVYLRDGWLLFGSELKALATHPAMLREVDRGSLAAFLRAQYVPDPACIYAHARKIAPGHILTVQDPGAALPDSRAFWSAAQVACAGLDNPWSEGPEAAREELDRLLHDAVRLRLVSDVPVGAFLSGGIDSSVVVALMQSQLSRPVKTFAIGFAEGEFNEAESAGAVARKLGTDHTELVVTPQEALDVVPRLGEMFDEPFADPSQIPTFLVSRLARRRVTVSLSGDGGDELFGGYNRYLWAPRVLAFRRRRSPLARSAIRAAVGTLAPSSWDRLARALHPVLPASWRYGVAGDKLYKMAAALEAPGEEAAVRTVQAAWPLPGEIMVGGGGNAWPESAAGEPEDLVDRMMLRDLVSYLPGDILAKVDRASMAVGLEARVPLLDHRVVAFAWRLPRALKMKDGVGKWILRQVLYRYLPRELFERPKTGFDIPLDRWLRGPLREWAEALLEPGRLRREGFFEPDPVRAAWSAHLSGRRNLHVPIWTVLMFQAWRERWAA